MLKLTSQLSRNNTITTHFLTLFWLTRLLYQLTFNKMCFTLSLQLSSSQVCSLRYSCVTTLPPPPQFIPLPFFTYVKLLRVKAEHTEIYPVGETVEREQQNQQVAPHWPLKPVGWVLMMNLNSFKNLLFDFNGYFLWRRSQCLEKDLIMEREQLSTT